jgi:nitroimidazol reductase NimA-like FMN-containing flavoprotein (pyridoxamine 5'-phosphate oxidase superfamily)
MTDKQHPEWMGKNRKLTPAEVKDFLAEPVVARIATIDENGVPYVTPVWQEWDGEAFWMVVRERAAWVAHIKKNPNVGISCAHDSGTYRRIVAQGKAEIVSGPAPMQGECLALLWQIKGLEGIWSDRLAPRFWEPTAWRTGIVIWSGGLRRSSPGLGTRRASGCCRSMWKV